jgi:ABC-type Fe3+-hydroxamate transport system substrate-binding protein
LADREQTEVTGIRYMRHILRSLPVLTAVVMLCTASPVLAEAPQRILSLAPAATEILFDLGLGDNVTGVTEYCTWPPEARSKPNVGDMMSVNTGRRTRHDKRRFQVDTRSVEQPDGSPGRQSWNVAVIRGDFTFRAGPRYPLILESFKKVIHEGVREIEE